MANIKPIIAAYVRRINKNLINIEEVPMEIRKEVQIALELDALEKLNQNGSDL